MAKKYFFIFFLIISTSFVFACVSKIPPKPPTLDANQLRSLQLSEIEGTFDTCFKACLYILQDGGWIIKSADKANGLIHAESIRTKSSFSPELDYLRSTHEELRDKSWEIIGGRAYGTGERMWERWNEADVSLEQWDKNAIKVRLSFVKKGFLPSRIYSRPGPLIIVGSIKSEPEESRAEVLDDPTIYQNFFAGVKKEISRRQKLEKEGVEKK